MLCSQVRGDFVLVSGDTVSNMSLKEVVKEHQERRKKDKLAVMTMVVKRVKPSPLTNMTRLGNDELLVAIDPQSKQLLHYDPGREAGGRDNFQHQSSSRNVILEHSALNDRPSVQLCTNLQVLMGPFFPSLTFLACGPIVHLMEKPLTNLFWWF